jgi:hypothetical protein
LAAQARANNSLFVGARNVAAPTTVGEKAGTGEGTPAERKLGGAAVRRPRSGRRGEQWPGGGGGQERRGSAQADVIGGGGQCRAAVRGELQGRVGPGRRGSAC